MAGALVRREAAAARIDTRGRASMAGGTKQVEVENRIREGFALEWSRQGLLVRCIDYHATQITITWERLLDLAADWRGDLVREATGADSVAKNRDAAPHEHREVGTRSWRLSESAIVEAVAEQACERIQRRTIRQLQGMRRENMQSGEGSGLENVWDEICVQMQDQPSILWDVYDDHVRGLVARHVFELREFEMAAIWIQTRDAEWWMFASDEDRDSDPDPVDPTSVTEHVAREYVYRAAGNWSNARIRDYFERAVST